MTYVSKKEKVFDLPVDQDESSSSISISGTETRLKRFPSVSDRKAWSAEECQRYQHFYGLVNGSETSVSKSSSFKYIPFDVLLAILMAEKDAYIQELLDRQDSRSSSGGKLFKAEGFDDSDDDREALIRKDAEVVALKNKIAGLESELEDYRETLTKAMHKLENMDAILSENNLLKEKIKYSEETIKCLEEKKEELEKEVGHFRKFYKIPPDKEPKLRYFESFHKWDGGDYEEITQLSSERDILLQKLEDLQRELEKARANAAEVEILRKISETTSCSLEEVTKENESYKKKLESMKCLEKRIEELKKQAQILTEKYKRESQKANDYLKQIKLDEKELSLLREERDKLQQRVSELIAYENQYVSLKGKLHQVELIIDENEMLNKKLIQLDRLEVENEQLKMTINQLKCAEVQATEDKEKILQLQCAVVDQEEEIRKMVRQIEILSQGCADKNEVHRLESELDEKNTKLKKYEKQLADIPVLESEIDELKNKLQKCIDDFKADKDLLKRLQEELEACRKRCHELEEMAPSCPSLPENSVGTFPISSGKREKAGNSLTFEEKGENTTEVSTRDVESQSDVPDEEKSKKTIDDTMKRIQDMEKQNVALKVEVDMLRQKLSEINLDEIISETNDLKNLLISKDKKIQELNADILRLQDEAKFYEKIEEDLKEQIEHLKERNCCLKKEIDIGQEVMKQMKESLKVEKKAREFAMNMVRGLEEKLKMERTKREGEEAIMKLQKEEANIVKQEEYLYFCKEVDDLKRVNNLYKKLLKELKTENDMLMEANEYLQSTENKGLKNLVNKLRAELDVLRSLSKPELENEYQELRNQIQKLLSETEGFLEDIEVLKIALDQEKKEKNSLKQDIANLQVELSACITAESEVLRRETVEKEALINELREELLGVRNALENSIREIQALKAVNEKLQEDKTNMESEQKDLKNEINVLLSRVGELNRMIREQENKEEGLRKEIQNYLGTIESQKEEISVGKGFTEVLKQRIKDLEEMVKAKEEELDATKKKSGEIRDEMQKIYSEVEVLRLRLAEKNTEAHSVGEVQDVVNYEKDLEEKYALEEALRKIENELDELKVKLEECKKMEDEMAHLRSKRDALIGKMSDFECEIERLNRKLADFEDLKNELIQLKANQKMTSDDLEVAELHQQLQEEKAQVDILKAENVCIREELKKAEALLEISRNLEKTIPQAPTMEFYTPPALPSPRSSGPADCVIEMIPLDTHKKELKDLEITYETKLEQMKERNAEKSRRLTENFEKEEKCRIKDFHDSINIVRSSYESDIRKLVEKHKTSIMRLQGLHEDEVQELNTHYETQMEAIQTQNENVINDLKTESAEKCRQLKEQHEREIKELESRYQEMLAEKENLFLVEKRSVEASLTQSTNDLNEVHKQALDSLTQFYQNSIVELEEKHNKEMRKCKKNNMKKIELMKNKYEALLVEERKKYEEQLEEMLLQLKKGEERNAGQFERSCTVEKKPVGATETRLEFIEVLQKIINEGFESLTFDEVILVHSKTCFMPRSAEEETGAGEYSPRFGDSCRHKELMTAEKEELLKRIFTLEHEIVIKQLETHEAIVNMETAEKYRIQELKNALFTAQQKNAELKRLLSNQSKLQTDLKIDRYMLDRQANLHETSVMEKVKELEREKAEKKRLEEELLKERMNAKHLTATLESEKERYRCQRKRDAEYVESIRQRLEEALNHEQMMEAQLEREMELRRKLESELHGSHKTYNFIRELSSNLLQIEPKTIKDVRNHDQSETLKEAKHGRSKSKHRNRSKTINNL